VLVRLGHSHIRFGTFQRLAFFERPDLIHVLVEHCCAAYYPRHLNLGGEARVAALFGEAVKANARLAGSWMAAGFVHGVLNTDNLNICGESFDYGPWRFVPVSDPSFTAAYFDETGLYSFSRQPEAVSWALAQLGGALSLVCPPPLLEAELRRFAPSYQLGLRDGVFGRLSLREGASAPDVEFLSNLFGWLTETRAGWDQFFHDWYGGAASAERAAASPQAALYAGAAFSPIRAAIEARTSSGSNPLLQQDYFQRPTPVTMLIDDVEALWAPIAERDDWSLFESKLSDVAAMREAYGRS
jgi:uncharacterized protein YdiU (UPF0061 family)